MSASSARAADGAAGRFFAFAQVEVPWPLGPPDGRHVVRDPATGAISHVVVLATLGTPERPRRLSRAQGRRRAALTRAPAAEPGPVTIGRATVIVAGRALGDATAARAWLDTAGEPELADGLAVLARVLQAHRIASADPYLVPVTRDALIAARLGYGTGGALMAGGTAVVEATSEDVGEARELGAPGRRNGRRDRPSRRPRALVPAARLAELLAGRAPALACEELVLRARVDLDAGRPREAALQLLVALDAALAELPTDAQAAALSDRIGQLRERREAVADAAQAALSGPPSAEAQAAVADTVARLEAALRARAAVLG